MSAQRLVAFLALQDRPLLRAFVAGTLWPDSPEERASANLRSVLWRLRGSGYNLVEANGQQLEMRPDVEVDIQELARLTNRLLDPSSAFPASELRRVSLLGELLPGWYDDWVQIERERVRQLRLHALETLCERLTEAGCLLQAVEAGIAAVAGEPLRETAHRALIRAHLAEGNPAEAIRQFEAYRKALREELGLEPSAQLQELVRSYLARPAEPTAASSSAAMSSSRQMRSGLARRGSGTAPQVADRLT
jgi:DNA-binding SARP family transcriptional activator